MTEPPLWQTLSEDELAFIASRDYGVDAELHLDALKKVLFEQDGCAYDGQHWYPYEVIELCAHWLQPGHAREFAACTLLVIKNVVQGHDRCTDLVYKFECRASDYARLPPELSEQIIAAYVASGLV